VPDSPVRNRLVAAESGAAPWITGALGGALAGGGSLLLGYGIFDATRKRRRVRK